MKKAGTNLFIMTIIGFFVLCGPAQSQPVNTPSELPGWPIDLPGGSRFAPGVVVTDIDDDGKDEVIMGRNNFVHIIDDTGGNVAGWPQQASDRIFDEISMVAVGDIDGDGDNEVVCTGEGGIYIWHFETGILVDGWPLKMNGDTVLANFDDDPLDLEIAIAVVNEYYSPELEIYVLNDDGTDVDGWPQGFDVDQLYRVYLSAGNIDNIDNDEIIVACHKRGYYPSPIYVFHGNGQLVSGWPIQGNGPFVSPAVLCNLDDDDDYEVVAATVNGSHTGQIYAWKPNGVSVSGWPVRYNAFHLAVGDLNSDDQPEIIASYSNSTYWGDHLAVLDRHGTRLLSKTLELRTAASLGNADYDTDSEIIIPTWNGELQVIDLDGQNLPGFPIYLGKGIMYNPSAMGDLDGDGDIEIVQLSSKIHAFDLKTLKSDRPDWPMARHDERRSSLWTPPQTAGSDVLEITGPLQVIEKTSTNYIAWAYFEDGSNRDVTLESDWWVDPCYVDYAHFESGGVLVANGVTIFKDIIIHARLTENGFDETASYEVRIRPTVQILYADDNAANDPGPNDPSISDAYECGTEEHPFDTIQEAIGVAGDGDTVIVLPGYYYENVDFMGKDFTLTSTNPNDPAIVASTVITDEGLGGLAVQASDGRLLGFTASGGISIGQWSTGTAYSSTISHCNITSTGMAIQINVPRYGQAVRPVIENNIITGRTCIYIFAHGNMNGIIRNNVLTSIGGNRKGTGIHYRTHSEAPYVVNNIITKLKQGIYLTYTSKLGERTARICYNNLYDNQENYHIDSPPTPLDLTGVNGNISARPFFVDYENGDFHLQSISPCIDAGDPDYIPESSETDIDGEPRVMGISVDMGADELFVNTPPIADAGPNQIAYAWIDGIAEVVLDGNDSNDPDGDELTYLWSWTIGPTTYETNSVSPAIELPVGEHIIGLIVNDGTEDSEPDEVTITVIEPMESHLWIFPQVINRRSRQRRIGAWLRLPEGVTRDQIDSDEPLLLYPDVPEANGIEAIRQYVFQNRRRRSQRTSILAFFDKAELMDAVGDNGSVELQVVGNLRTGQYFYGTDTVWITDWRRTRLRRVVSR